MLAAKKIVVIGPESSGKTTLCQALAKNYQTQWVPEYARTYLEENGSSYQYEDLEKIAIGQLQLEDRLYAELKQPKPIFLDTNLEVIKIWSHEVFGRCSTHILNELSHRTYDFYLLCKPDLIWAPDPLRENEDLNKRERHYHLFLDTLVHAHLPFAIIDGQGDNRIHKAIQKLYSLLNNK